MTLVLATSNGIQPIKGSGTLFTLGDAKNQCIADLSVQLDPIGTSIYLYSDGITDQFDALGNSRFGSTRLHALLGSMAHMPMEAQQARFIQEMGNWKGDATQTDDMSLTGIRLAPAFLKRSARSEAA